VVTKSQSNRGHGIRRRATGASLAIQAGVDEQASAARLVRRHARDEHDAQDLLGALGLADGIAS